MAHPGSIFQLQALDARGEEILDALESRAPEVPVQPLEHGRREYHLNAAGPDGFDPLLKLIDPDWEEHVERVPTGA
jgi:hypothetical protein